MDKKRILQTLFIGFICLFIVTKVVRLVIDYYIPSFLFELIDQAKADKALMERIGGYEEYRFSYSSPDRAKLHFELSIIGDDSTITYEGQATKLSERQWRIEQVKSTVWTP
ncbi:hypothetical protein [Spirosoma jeollabukense]